ncbi:snRNA-activating protein complex subunit 3 [Pelomyxa schiedti]|nr:snRNA-activating protein complex subunit 3 [Pelomyxa schiedti]
MPTSEHYGQRNGAGHAASGAASAGLYHDHGGGEVESEDYENENGEDGDGEEYGNGDEGGAAYQEDYYGSAAAATTTTTTTTSSYAATSPPPPSVELSFATPQTLSMATVRRVTSGGLPPIIPASPLPPILSPPPPLYGAISTPQSPPPTVVGVPGQAVPVLGTPWQQQQQGAGSIPPPTITSFSHHDFAALVQTPGAIQTPAPDHEPGPDPPPTIPISSASALMPPPRTVPTATAAPSSTSAALAALDSVLMPPPSSVSVSHGGAPGAGGGGAGAAALGVGEDAYLSSTSRRTTPKTGRRAPGRVSSAVAPDTRRSARRNQALPTGASKHAREVMMAHRKPSQKINVADLARQFRTAVVAVPPVVGVAAAAAAAASPPPPHPPQQLQPQPQSPQPQLNSQLQLQTQLHSQSQLHFLQLQAQLQLQLQSQSQSQLQSQSQAEPLQSNTVALVEHNDVAHVAAGSGPNNLLGNHDATSIEGLASGSTEPPANTIPLSTSYTESTSSSLNSGPTAVNLPMTSSSSNSSIPPMDSLDSELLATETDISYEDLRLLSDRDIVEKRIQEELALHQCPKELQAKLGAIPDQGLLEDVRKEQPHNAPLESLQYIQKNPKDPRSVYTRRHINFVTENMREKREQEECQMENQELVGTEEIVLTVAIYHPTKLQKHQEFAVLGSQKLTELKDKIYCLNNNTSAPVNSNASAPVDNTASEPADSNPSAPVASNPSTPVHDNSAINGNNSAPVNNSTPRQIAPGHVVASAHVNYPSSFFFIEGTFYDDMREPNNIRYSVPIIEFANNITHNYKRPSLAKSRQSKTSTSPTALPALPSPNLPPPSPLLTSSINFPPRTSLDESEEAIGSADVDYESLAQSTPCTSTPQNQSLGDQRNDPRWKAEIRPHNPELWRNANMEDTSFSDLCLRTNEPYLFCHQATCEHIIIFTDVRLVTDFDEHKKSSYPLLVYQNRIYAQKCTICELFDATTIVYNDSLAPTNPCYFCATCYRLLHYEPNGTGRHRDHLIYDYRHD